jgi:hypothetical protein
MRKFFLLLLLFLCITKSSFAATTADFKTDYDVDYAAPADSQAATQVKFVIKITNLKPEVYVDQYTLAIPSSFSFENIQASDDRGPMKPTQTISENTTLIQLPLNNPKIGLNSTNTVNVTFDQHNLIHRSGAISEITIPTVQNRREGDYRVTLHLPEATDMLSIAKPKPASINGQTITWDNPQVKTIYGIVGQKQTYTIGLAYQLKNDALTPSQKQITFPPDTQYQKVYVDSIDPSPSKLELDADGNYIGTYNLNPKQELTVHVSGQVAVNTQPREELTEITAARYAANKNLLISTTVDMWKLKDASSYKPLSDTQHIYDFLVNTFHYDFDRASKNGKRLGAQLALYNPTRALCSEYSDSFVAIAREHGIPSVEIEGYAYGDATTRPVSLVKDVLHAWPAYYDEANGRWVLIDPTWGSTSGVDYYSSFDLNHIAFAIHGASAQVPRPAGMDKLNDQRAVTVETSTTVPVEKKSFAVKLDTIKLADSMNDANDYAGSIEIINTGNTFVYNVPIQITGESLSINLQTKSIDVLAPYQSKVISFSYKALPKRSSAKASIAITTGGTQLLYRQITITPVTYSVTLALSIGFIVICGIIMFALTKLKRR